MDGYFWLPEALTLRRGGPSDYAALARFHYCARPPATWAGVWVVQSVRGPAAVAVLSWPTLRCAAREAVLGWSHLPSRERAQRVNAELRTISRVIVHPRFRGIGLASALVRRVLAEAPTAQVEALAHMGRAHPFFAAAGMRAYPPADERAPVYYLWQRPLSGPASHTIITKGDIHD